MDFEVNVADGWVFGAERVYSPNFDERPAGCEPDLIVVHGISLPPGQFGGRFVDELFTNRLDPGAHPYFNDIAHLRVSAHALIRRDGTLTQFVAFADRAWHAGESDWCGRRSCNDFAVGIELEGTDDLAYTAEQYATLAALVVALRRAYPGLRDAQIVGHSDIAPGRKTDPGPAFDWAWFERALKSASA